MRKWMLITAAVSLLAFGLVSTVLAHGVEIDYTVETAVTVQLQAEFDTGEVMSEAQVTVYAPDDPATPWLTGTADEQGRFTFVPDMSMPGTWDVQFRKAGHGDIVHIEIDEGSQVVARAGPGGYTPMQIILMSATGIWGFVGTALFFTKKRG